LQTFIACATGPAIKLIEPGCEPTDLDDDGDVDSVDFAMFQRSWTGGLP
jgi:hypothetical protein